MSKGHKGTHVGTDDLMGRRFCSVPRDPHNNLHTLYPEGEGDAVNTNDILWYGFPRLGQ